MAGRSSGIEINRLPALNRSVGAAHNTGLMAAIYYLKNAQPNTNPTL
jgi:hypothetical protein